MQHIQRQRGELGSEQEAGARWTMSKSSAFIWLCLSQHRHVAVVQLLRARSSWV
jgi:hypothetical protein